MGIWNEVCGVDAVPQLLRSQTVDVTIGTIRASVSRRGCMAHCSTCRAAQVTSGEHLPETVTFQSAGELREKLRVIHSRNPEQWAKISELRAIAAAATEAYRKEFIASLESDYGNRDGSTLIELQRAAEAAFHAWKQALLPEREKSEEA